jgi:hypothetical protein
MRASMFAVIIACITMIASTLGLMHEVQLRDDKIRKLQSTTTVTTVVTTTTTVDLPCVTFTVPPGTLIGSEGC